MSLSNFVPVIVTIGTIYLLQLWLSNKSGSEQQIRDSITSVKIKSWSFVALQYCYGISNRTYLIFVTENMICGVKVRGPLPAPMNVTERWNDPLFYPRPEIVSKYSNVDIESNEVKRIDSANFQIPRADIETIIFSGEPKWGMGTVPYSGRLFIKLKTGSKIELILLGVQDGEALRDRLFQSGFGEVIA